MYYYLHEHTTGAHAHYLHFTFHKCLILLFFNVFVASSVLSATPSPTSQSGPNITTPNVPSTPASSMEKPMISTIGKYNNMVVT